MNLLNLPLVPPVNTEGVRTFQQKRAAEVGVLVNGRNTNGLGLLMEGGAALVEMLHADRERLEAHEGKLTGMTR